MSFFPGTYGTSLLRNHVLRGACNELTLQGFPQAVIDGVRDMSDCNFYFFDNAVQIWQMYLVLLGTTALLVGAYVLITTLSAKKRMRVKNGKKK